MNRSASLIMFVRQLALKTVGKNHLRSGVGSGRKHTREDPEAIAPASRILFPPLHSVLFHLPSAGKRFAPSPACEVFL